MQRVQCFRVRHGLTVPLRYRLSVDCQRPLSLLLRALSFIIVATAIPGLSHAAEIESCERLLRSGQYQQCIETAEAAILKKSYGSEWPLFKAQAELAVGQYVEARQTVDAGLKRYSWSLPLRFLAFQILSAK